MADNSEDIFEKAKEKSLSEYLQHALGAKVSKSGHHFRMDASPCCGHSSIGSGKLKITGDRNWHCYGCGQFGTIIDAAMCLDGQADSALHAAQIIVNGDIPPAIAPEVKAAQIEADSIKRQWQSWVVQRIHEASRSHFDRAAWDFLVRVRGIKPEVVNSAWQRGVLAGLPSGRDEGTLWLKSVVGEQELRYAGLWKDDQPTPWIAGRSVVQFVDDRNYAEFRFAFKPTGKMKKSLSVGTPGTPYYWRGKDSTRCLVTEACLENLAALSMGYTGSLLATAGTGSWNLSWFKALAKQGVQVFDLAFNNDVSSERVDADGNPVNPGQAAQADLAKQLAQEGLRFTNASPREPGDLNDALLRLRSKT